MSPQLGLWLAGFLLAPVCLLAQTPGRVLQLRIQTSVAGNSIDLDRIEGAFVRADGSLVLGDAGGYRVLIVDPSGKVRTVGREDEGPGEFKNIRGVGPSPDGGFWVADMVLLRAQVFDFDGSLSKTLRLSMYTQVPPSSSRFVTYPVAYLGGERLLLHAGSSGSSGSQPGSRTPMDDISLVAVVAPDSHPRPVVWYHKRACSSEDAPGGTIPFCSDQESVVSPDGRVAFVVTDSSGGGLLARVGVTAVATAGSGSPRNFVMIIGQRRRVLGWERDSLRARWSRAFSRVSRARAKEFQNTFDNLKLPTFHAGFDKLMVSSGGIAWIGSPAGDGRNWVLIDSTGTVRGHLMLPMTETPVAATGDFVWTTRPDHDGFLDLRRYRFQ